MRNRSLAILVGVLAVAAAAAGDELVVGKTRYRQCILSGAKDGMILFRLSQTGPTIRKPMTDVKSIRLSSLELFNEAEKLREGGRPGEAVGEFDNLIRAIRGGWKNRLIRYRLLQALGEAGQSDRWVSEWSRIVSESDSKSAVLAYRPKKLAPKGSPANGRAITALEKLRAEARGKAWLGAVKALLLKLYQHEGRKEADALAEELLGSKKGPEAPATTNGKEEPDSPQALEQQLRGAAFVLQKDPAKALGVIEDNLHHYGPGELSQALLLAGKAQSGLAGRAGGQERRKWLLKAGLSFMRVYAHFPGSDEAPEALYQAGRVNAMLPDPAAARAAYQRVIGRFPESPEAKAARTALAGLGE